MSHVRSLSAVLLGLHIVGRTYAQNNVTVEESDAALVYTPFKSTWDSFGNPQTRADGTVDDNYFHGGNCLAIKLPGATVSLTFNGSYIAYYSDMMNNHGSMSVTLDGKITTLNTFNAAGGVRQVKLFESFVDPNTPNHTITLTCLETKNMGLDYFLYTAATPTM
ncbi:hypothetical protein EXIGLDRAFT_65860 [Exidia glandulosa HHB12029]|uniref:Uncharacterized protein n=1 Tax=Exidia glandulosa HHB12029 TaxID=1314781 RepID=A0A165P2V5_EXIGL|nr:hypothetical protein EXIGLDRAFT_65860 [Exidia glandulosa HHB12029]